MNEEIKILETQYYQEPNTDNYRIFKQNYGECKQSLSRIEAINNPLISRNITNIDRARKEYTVEMLIDGQIKWILNEQGKKIIENLNWENVKLRNAVNSQGAICNGIYNDMQKEKSQYQADIATKKKNKTVSGKTIFHTNIFKSLSAIFIVSVQL